MRTSPTLLPYKAIIMLTVADFICSGLIDTPKIQFNQHFKEQFVLNWRKYSKDTSLLEMPDIQKQIIMMQQENFWKVSTLDDSLFVLDVDLFTYLKNRSSCFILRKTLVEKFLPLSINDFNKEYEIVNADIM